jgi:hypothetical protein
MSSPSEPQPVPAGEPVTIQPAETGPEPEAPPQEVAPPPYGQPPGAVVQPPDAGVGQQSLAEQQAAGSSVTADVPQPEPGPGASDSALAPAAVTPPDQPAGTEPEAELSHPVSPATSNESPTLPPNLTSSAARAHAMLEQAQGAGSDGQAQPEDRLGRVLSIVELALSELAKFLPDHVRAPAQVEAQRAVDRL